MYDVVLFGGTDEGHKIADFLSEQKKSVTLCALRRNTVRNCLI